MEFKDPVTNRKPRWLMSAEEQAARWEMKEQIIADLNAAIEHEPRDRQPFTDAIQIVRRVEASDYRAEVTKR